MHFHVFGLMPNDTSILFYNPKEIPTNIKVGNWSICQKIWSKDVFSDCSYTAVLFVDCKLRHTWICTQFVMSYVCIALPKIMRKTDATWKCLSLKRKLAFYWKTRYRFIYQYSVCVFIKTYIISIRLQRRTQYSYF